MLRRVLAIGLVAFIFVGCGGSTPSQGPATTAPAVQPTLTPTLAPSEPPSPGAAAAKTATCNAIGVRKSPSVAGTLLARLDTGAVVNAADTVSGDAYTVGACGTSGKTWFEIDEINGKTVQSLYGVPFAYAAAGMFK